MLESHAHRPIIPLVPSSVSRPVWSVMIPTYNCAHYLRETLTSVLAQDPGPECMQIEVVDDCSTEDDPEAVVRELAGERVAFYRQPQNVGHVKNFNTCLQRSRGSFIHLLHGDDCVRGGFYRKMERAFATNKEIGAAFCRYIWMDEQSHWQLFSSLLQPRSGILDNWLERIASKQLIQTPAIAVRRSVYERLGGFDERIAVCGEDWEMWVRIAANYSIWYEIEPLAIYRTHSMSLARRSSATGKNISDVRLAVEISHSYLPPRQAAKTTGRAREGVSRWALKIASYAIELGDWRLFLVQMREALKTSLSPRIMGRALILMLLFFWQSILRKLTDGRRTVTDHALSSRFIKAVREEQ